MRATNKLSLNGAVTSVAIMEDEAGSCNLRGSDNN